MQSVLTSREFEIARLVARGKTNRAVADALCVSRRTVENHLYAIFAKLEIHTRTELAFLLYRAQATAFAL